MTTSSDYPIPECFRNARAADFREHKQRAEIKEAATKPSLYLFGGNGVGKSYLAAAILNAKGGGSWVSVPKLMLRIKSSFRPNADETEYGILMDIWDRKRIVIDDLLAAHRTDFGMATLLVLINERVERQLETIVTCDRHLSEVDQMDSSLASRLGSFWPLKLSGDDRRLKK